MRRALWISTLLLSFALTFAAKRGDDWLGRRRETDLALKFARQIASQASALVLYASEAGVNNPTFWAAKILNQGPEGKILQVSKVEDPGKPSEAYSIRDSIFDYESILVPTTGDGVRIEIFLGYRGFLGARSPLGEDISLALFFAALQTVLYCGVGIFSGALRYSEARTQDSPRAA